MTLIINRMRRLLIIEAESRTTKIYPLSLSGLGDCIFEGCDLHDIIALKSLKASSVHVLK